MSSKPWSQDNGQPPPQESTSRGRSSALLELGRALAPKRQRNTCSNCAHENVSTAKFCGECGAKLDVDLPDANKAEDVHAEEGYATTPASAAAAAASKSLARAPYGLRQSPRDWVIRKEEELSKSNNNSNQKKDDVLSSSESDDEEGLTVEKDVLAKALQEKARRAA